jgi:transcriptional regulator with XRE-family HTH domain
MEHDMTAALSGDAGPSLRDRVAEEVRATLGRRRMSGAELARQLGRSQTFVQKRLDGRQAFDVDDIEAVARILGVDPHQLLGGSPFRSAAPQAGNPRDSARTMTNQCFQSSRHLRLVSDSGASQVPEQQESGVHRLPPLDHAPLPEIA